MLVFERKTQPKQGFLMEAIFSQVYFCVFELLQLKERFHGKRRFLVPKEDTQNHLRTIVAAKPNYFGLPPLFSFFSNFL